MKLKLIKKCVYGLNLCVSKATYWLSGKVEWVKNKLLVSCEDKNKDAFRCCCAMAYLTNSGNDIKDILRLIGKKRGLKLDYINKTIGQIWNNDDFDEKCNDRKKREIIKLLYNVSRIICADGKITDNEKLVFEFICIRLGVLKDDVRKKLMEIIFGLIEESKKIQLESKEKIIDTICEDCKNYDFVDINLNYIENQSDIFNSVLKADDRDDYEAELEAIMEIITEGGDLDDCLHSIFSQDYNGKDGNYARLLFELYNIIMFDDKVNEDEERMFKTFAIIFGLNKSKYRELRHVLRQHNTLNGFGSGEFKDRLYVRKKTVKLINNVLKRDEVHLKDRKIRFALVCSIAYVDGELKDKEKVELYSIGINSYYLNKEEIDEIIEDVKDPANSKYVNDLLVNIPSDEGKRIEDLKNCLKVINSDDIITDAERNVFDIVCIFYGVKQNYFKSSDFRNGKKILRKKYQYDIDKEGKVIITIQDYYKLRGIFKYRTIHGVLSRSVEYALNKKFCEFCKNLDKKDRSISYYSFTVFIVSVLVLLLYVNYTSHHSYEESKRQYVVGERSYETMQHIDDISVFHGECLVSDINTEENGGISDNASISCAVKDKISKKSMLKTSPDEIIDMIEDTPECFVLVLAFILLLGYFLSQIPRPNFRKWNILIYISLFLLALLLLSRELIYSVFLLSAMLSIEWLILMREKYQEKEKKGAHSSLLVVLVLMAILSDISFGMIELQQVYTEKNILDKVFSALFLGCVCFFVGKYLELNYTHNNEDKKYMMVVIEEIKKSNNKSRLN